MHIIRGGWLAQSEEYVTLIVFFNQILAGLGGLKQSTLPTPSLPLMLMDWHHHSGALCQGGVGSLASPAGKWTWRQAEVLGRMGL